MIRRIGIVILLAIGIAAIVFAFSSGSGDDNKPTTSGVSTGGDVAVQAVERFVPAEGTLAVRQDQVGVDLKPGYDADLIVENHQIPEDQLMKNQPLNEVFYRPGKGKEVQALDAGPMCVTALIKDLRRPDDPAQPVKWCFRVA